MPAAVRDDLAAQLAPYRQQHSGARWTEGSSWHLTLVFLGQVDPRWVAPLGVLLDEAAAAGAPYRARADHADGRLQRGEGVGWLALGVGAGRLIALAEDLAERCPPGVTDGPPPRRTPSAHLTLVRKADAATIDALRRQAHGRLGVEWQVDRICLLRSHLGTDAARYETLHEATL